MDKNCTIAPGASIGQDPDEDRLRFPFITPAGIVVLPKGTHVPVDGPVQFSYDMVELMCKDPSTREQMAMFEGRYGISNRSRHSHESAGPRYEKFGPGGVVPA